jgi:hypothetical protein
MDFKLHLETAWNLTLKHLVPLILMTLVMFVVSFFTLGILAPVMMAGYFQSVVLMMRTGREPTMGDLFSQMRLFFPLLLFSILVVIAAMVGFMLLFLPGLIVILAVTFGCLYMLPLMTDKRMDLSDAVKTSWQMATRDKIADHVVVVILFVGLMAIGGSVFIGTLFTQPFATVFIVSVYLDRVGTAAVGSTPTPPPPPYGNG